MGVGLPELWRAVETWQIWKGGLHCKDGLGLESSPQLPPLSAEAKSSGQDFPLEKALDPR